MSDEPAPPKRNRVQRRASQLLQELDKSQRYKTVMEEEPPRTTGAADTAVATVKRKRIQRRGSQELPDQASLEGPPVVMAGDGAKAPPLPMHLKILVAPLAGMLAGALEITSLWPMEWAAAACAQKQQRPPPSPKSAEASSTSAPTP